MREVEMIKRNLVELPQKYEKAAYESARLEYAFKVATTNLESLQARKRLELKATSDESATDRKDRVIESTVVQALEVLKAEADFKAAEVQQESIDKQIQTTRNLCNLACAEIYAGMHTADDTFKVKRRED